LFTAGSAEKTPGITLVTGNIRPSYRLGPHEGALFDGGLNMMAQDIIQRAKTICRHRRIGFPSDLLQYAHQWQREQFDIEFCWRLVKPLLTSGPPLLQAENDIRRHHDQLQRDRNARDLKAGEPLETTPATGEESWWETQDPEQVSDEDPQEYLPSPTSAMDVTGAPGGDRPCAEPRQTLRSEAKVGRDRPRATC
jgi:hypothetical protein